MIKCLYSVIVVARVMHLPTAGLRSGSSQDLAGAGGLGAVRHLGGASAVPLALLGLLQPDTSGSVFFFPESTTLPVAILPATQTRVYFHVDAQKNTISTASARLITLPAIRGGINDLRCFSSRLG